MAGSAPSGKYSPIQTTPFLKEAFGVGAITPMDLFGGSYHGAGMDAMSRRKGTQGKTLNEHSTTTDFFDIYDPEKLQKFVGHQDPQWMGNMIKTAWPHLTNSDINNVLQGADPRAVQFRQAFPNYTEAQIQALTGSKQAPVLGPNAAPFGPPAPPPDSVEGLAARDALHGPKFGSAKQAPGGTTGDSLSDALALLMKRADVKPKILSDITKLGTPLNKNV